MNVLLVNRHRIIAALCLLLLSFHTARAEQALVFGIVPQQIPAKTARLWGPFVNYLATRTGVNVQFRTAKDIPSFDAEMRKGAYDIVYSNPYQYIQNQKTIGYTAFAKERGRRLTGIIVVAKDKNIKTFQDLNQATLVFPAPYAFGASMIPRAILKSRGISFEAKYVNNHESVYRSVAQGLFPAGGGVMSTFEEISPDIKSKLDVLWKSDGYTPHAFSAHPRVDQETVARITAALVEMEHDARGHVLLERLGMRGVESAVDSDWNDARGIENLLR